MTNSQKMRSLALSVHFRNPSFGMKKHEILSRATAFLLAVDPIDPDANGIITSSGGSSFSHFGESQKRIEADKKKRQYRATPAGMFISGNSWELR